MIIDTIEEWVSPETSYSFSAWETFTGKYFRFRTGPQVSVLNTIVGDFEIKLIGEIKVANDDDCWAIVAKFGKISDVVDVLLDMARESGEEIAKKQLREWLGVRR